MKYTKVIVQEHPINLNYKLEDDVQNIIATALLLNNNDVKKALKWIKDLDVETSSLHVKYEIAVKDEAYLQLLKVVQPKQFDGFDHEFFNALDYLFGGGAKCQPK